MGLFSIEDVNRSIAWEYSVDFGKCLKVCIYGNISISGHNSKQIWRTLDLPYEPRGEIHRDPEKWGSPEVVPYGLLIRTLGIAPSLLHDEENHHQHPKVCKQIIFNSNDTPDQY